MATFSAQATSNQPLKYKTWVLKVSIHCEGCSRKVLKILHKINGVYTICIDSQLQRVTVTGNVDIETLIKRLTKTGKHAELWPENIAGEEKKLAGKSKNNDKENDPRSSRNTNINTNNNNDIKKMELSTSTCTATTTSTVMSEAEKSTGNEASQRSKERESSTEKKSPAKKKKRQGQNGNFSSATGSHTNQGVSVNQPYYYYNNYYNYPRDDYYNIWPSSSTVYANRSYTAPHPSKTPAQFCNYATPSWPYTCPSGYQEVYDHGGFEIFSDENANGCFIM